MVGELIEESALHIPLNFPEDEPPKLRNTLY